MQTNNETQTEASELERQVQLISNRCSQCQRCVAECQFLRKYGDPKKISDHCLSSDSLQLAFECSLCGLCHAVCPDQVEPENLFLEMRREAVKQKTVDLSPYKRLLAYEQKGTSERFSWYGLPADCDTVFFPGCALSGTRPEQTRHVFESLQQQIPNVGIVLDCCTKPSHDLGRQDYFSAMFGELKSYLLAQGIKQVLVACPNCYQVFSEYGGVLETRTIYELLDAQGPANDIPISGTVHVHDPCVTRFVGPVQQAVRSLIEKNGLQISETRHNRKTTLCCGEGGAVGCFSPELSKSWGVKWNKEVSTNRTLTYCAGCANYLGQHAPTSHVLDLLYAPVATMQGKAKVAKAPLTYFNRLRLKRELQKSVATVNSRARTFSVDLVASPSWVKRLVVPALVVGAVLALRGAGVI